MNSDVYVEVLPGLPGGTLDFIHIHYCSQVTIIIIYVSLYIYILSNNIYNQFINQSISIIIQH
jgi:hypothetical protein